MSAFDARSASEGRQCIDSLDENVPRVKLWKIEGNVDGFEVLGVARPRTVD
jgi:hypothetical protein